MYNSQNRSYLGVCPAIIWDIPPTYSYLNTVSYVWTNLEWSSTPTFIEHTQSLVFVIEKKKKKGVV